MCQFLELNANSLGVTLTKSEHHNATASLARPTVLFSLPNLFSYVRLVGSFGLVVLAAYGLNQWMIVDLAVLLLTDWIDGRIARYLKQQTQYGAVLDSVADITMYGAILVAAIWFAPEIFRAHAVWILVGLASYGANVLACVLKFRRFPSFHTWLAKSCWLLVAVTLLCVLLDWATWPVLVTAIVVIIANLEAVLITILLPEYQVDVPHFFQAIRRRKVLTRN